MQTSAMVRFRVPIPRLEKGDSCIGKSEKSFENLVHFVESVSGAGIKHYPEADGTIRVQISAADEKAGPDSSRCGTPSARLSGPGGRSCV